MKLFSRRLSTPPLRAPRSHRRFSRSAFFGAALALFSLRVAAQVVIQTNFGTGDGTLPGPYGISSTDLLQTSLAAPAIYSGGTFYRFGDPGYESNLTLLTDGSFGGSGGVPSASVLPDSTTLTFQLDTSAHSAGYTIDGIRTYAGWDSGRDGQQYTVQYSLVGSATDFLSLATITRFDNTTFPTHLVHHIDFDFDTGDFLEYDSEDPDTSQSATLVELTASSGPLAENVAALRFVFTGIENGGTGYREFDVIGEATVSAVPEPSTYAAIAGLVTLGIALRRRLRSARPVAA